MSTKAGALCLAFALAAGLFFVSLNVKNAGAAGSKWIIEPIDAPGSDGDWISLAVDSVGRPHVSYSFGAGGLKYARWDGSGWINETVDPSEMSGYCTSIAIDSNNRPHISYGHDGSFESLMYAMWDGAEWKIDVADSANNVGEYTSIALDKNNKPHISHLDVTNYDLRYTRRSGGLWISDTVDSEGQVGWYSSIALDKNDYPHITYLDATNRFLKYASWNGSAWQVGTVDSSGEVGDATSLALDHLGYPHVAYVSWGRPYQFIRYARWNGTAWNIETVDALPQHALYASLALDQTDNPHIAYYDFQNGDLRYAQWTPAGWRKELVDSDGNVGLFPSIDVDSNGYVHIAYHDETQNRPKHAKAPGNTPPETPSTPSGPILGLTEEPYSYSTSALDPDGDWIKYDYDWGDGTFSETSFVASGADAIASHIWSSRGAYNVRVRAIDSLAASSNWSAPLAVQIVQLPGPPLGLAATPANGQITLTWSSPLDTGGSPITGYTIHRGIAPEGEGFLTQVADVTSYVDSGLSNGQLYCYKVSAQNLAGKGLNSTEACAIPATTPSEPLNLRALAGNRQATLTWEVPATDGGSPIADYRVYRGLVSGGESFLVSVGDTVTYLDEGLANGVAYYYRVAAVNAIGEGKKSSEVSVTPTNLQPVCEIATPLNDSSVSGVSPIAGTAHDPDGIVEMVEIKLDDGDWTRAFGTTLWTYSWDTVSVPNGFHVIRARSFDGYDYSSDCSVTVTVKNMPHGEGDTFPVIPVSVAIGGGAVLTTFLLFEQLRTALLTLLVLGAAKLRRKEDNLENEKRGMIRGYLAANPGANYVSIRNDLKIARGTLVYHLYVMEKQGLIRSWHDGRLKRFALSSERISGIQPRITDIELIVLQTLKNNPNLTQEGLAEEIGVKQPTISYHVKKLTKLGLLKAERRGIRNHYTTIIEGTPPHMEARSGRTQGEQDAQGGETTGTSS